jgi:hypothetical protein
VAAAALGLLLIRHGDLEDGPRAWSQHQGISPIRGSGYIRKVGALSIF